MQHQMQVTASAALPTPLSPTLVRAFSPVFEKFSFFKRIGRRIANKVNVGAPSPKSSSTESQHSPSGPIPLIWSTSSIGTPDTGLREGQKFVHISRSATMPHTNYIEVGGRGVVPQLDAPRGASNHVAILCKGVPVDIPIDGNTTVRQVLVELSATRWGQAINPNTAVIIESFNKLGIERRLRREERIRDILSTWGNETENALVLSLEVRETDEELDLSNVPKSDQAPKGFVVNMHYLRGPNKWSKRYIILNESGQLVASKKQDPRPGDKDVIQCCHLSDYDIYIPTEAQMRKNLKPPKKYCFAVKSQQKESLFVNTGNYVHFFSTEDPSVARKFRSHVHAWRSWYLATRLELLERDKKPPQTVPAPPQSRRMSISRERPAPNGYKPRISVDESAYPTSPPEPLINSKRLNQPLEEYGKTRTSEQTTELLAPKPLSPAKAAIVEANAAEFAANGLLGSAYEERRQQAQKEEKWAGQAHYDDPSSPASPFTDGPSLLNQQAGPGASHASPKADYAQLSSKTDRKPLPQMVAGKPAGWFPSALEHSAQQRTSNPPVQLPSQPLVRRPSNGSRMQQPIARSMSRRIPQDGPGPGTGLEHGHPQRRANQPPQPLIDLTPGFVEAPQWSREGRGRGVRAPQGKPLVDLATGPSASLYQEGPPKPLIRREDVPPPSSAGQTLLQQQESRAAAAAAASGARPMNSSRAAAPIVGRPTTSSGPMRRGTVKSSAGGMVGAVGGGRPGTSGSYGQQGPMQGQSMQGQQHVMTESSRSRGVSMSVGEKVGGWIGGVGKGQMGENTWQQQGQNQGQHRRRGMSAAVGGHQMVGGQQRLQQEQQQMGQSMKERGRNGSMRSQ
ncbi:hypothetical protein QBC42DRAFT_257553 [Cladorrhinum samala]|uniref:PH domain-containing protein n=1 Tax=Cladorrhinum samala TaxID=585594 RepID=A0AAV9I236_9PEZI|nr:hypothetical protein QBC42DRAFT_257553 [Cladorrhinum samala]